MIRRSVTWAGSSRGVVFAMAVIMAGLTITMVVEAQDPDVGYRPLLVGLSALSAVVSFGVVIFGREPSLVGWAGVTCALYCLVRSVLWLLAGSWSGMLAWQLGVLLGVAVFSRRQNAPEGGGHEGRPA